jgi:TonB family protein
VPFIPMPDAVVAVAGFQAPVELTGGDGMADPTWHWTDMLLVAYVVGVAFSFALLAWRLFRLRALLQTSTGEAWSFFARVMVPDNVDERSGAALRAHEQAHVRLGHSYDVMFYEVAAALSWWNPLWRVGLRELRTVHEYQADAAAALDHAGYDRVLLAHALGVPASTLTNSSRSSTLNTRIAMLHKARSPRRAGLKYALIVPVLAISLITTAWTAVPLTIAQQVELSEVDKQPEFPGGMEAMFAYLGGNTQYPADAREAGIEGKVYVEFVIASSGKVGKVTVKRGVHASLDREAVRVVSSMPDWKPGEKDGKKVAVRYILPMVFKLTTE